MHPRLISTAHSPDPTPHTILMVTWHPLGRRSPGSVYTRWVRLGAAPVDWVRGSVVGAMGARGRAVKRSGPRGEEEQNDWLSERGRLVPLIPLPPLSLSPPTARPLSYARVTTSLHGRAAREQRRQHPPTDRRWGGAGAI